MLNMVNLEFFIFDKQLLLQLLLGAAMGSRSNYTFACTFVGMLEVLMLLNWSQAGDKMLHLWDCSLCLQTDPGGDDHPPFLCPSRPWISPPISHFRTRGTTCWCTRRRSETVASWLRPSNVGSVGG